MYCWSFYPLHMQRFKDRKDRGSIGRVDICVCVAFSADIPCWWIWFRCAIAIVEEFNNLYLWPLRPTDGLSENQRQMNSEPGGGLGGGRDPVTPSSPSIWPPPQPLPSWVNYYLWCCHKSLGVFVEKGWCGWMCGFLHVQVDWRK